MTRSPLALLLAAGLTLVACGKASDDGTVASSGRTSTTSCSDAPCPSTYGVYSSPSSPQRYHVLRQPSLSQLMAQIEARFRAHIAG